LMPRWKVGQSEASRRFGFARSGTPSEGRRTMAIHGGLAFLAVQSGVKWCRLKVSLHRRTRVHHGISRLQAIPSKVLFSSTNTKKFLRFSVTSNLATYA
jgi:hypothetical protein